MKVSDYIVKFLVKQNIDIVFGYTGGSIADLIDSIYKTDGIEFVQSYNEQASAFAANAYSQVSGKVGVAISSSGPGAINLLNGIANAFYDSIPCVFITGNVHTLGRKRNDEIRQNAFQETDIVEIAKSITKYSSYIKSETEVESELIKAFEIANSGRKGPVLIDIPYDIQRKEMLDEKITTPKKFDHRKKLNMDEVVKKIQLSHRPLFLVGGGCQESKKLLRRLLDKIHIPVVASMRGIDIVSHNSEEYIGFIGTYGNQWANMAVFHSDLLLVLGSRLDERQMGYNKSDFAPNAQIVQVDIDPMELGRKTDNVLSINSSVDNFLDELLLYDIKFTCEPWVKLLRSWKKKYLEMFEVEKKFVANYFIRQLSHQFDNNSIIIADVGQNQILAAQSVYIKQDSQFLCSAGLACMGYSLPAAIGAYYASQNRKIVSLNGDGGFMMNMQELQTIKREKIPIVIIVLNNSCLGLIRKLQENLFENRYYASIVGYEAPNIQKIAEAFNIDYVLIDKLEELADIKQLLNKNKAIIMEVKLPYKMETMSEPEDKIYIQKPRLLCDEYEKMRRQAERI